MKTEFGDTCPYLKIAQKHAVPYDVVLMAADLYTHGRLPVGSHTRMDMPDVDSLASDIKRQADRFMNLSLGKETL